MGIKPTTVALKSHPCASAPRRPQTYVYIKAKFLYRNDYEISNYNFFYLIYTLILHFILLQPIYIIDIMMAEKRISLAFYISKGILEEKESFPKNSTSILSLNPVL